jgi:non-homologous end joining protein Ku
MHVRAAGWRGTMRDGENNLIVEVVRANQDAPVRFRFCSQETSRPFRIASLADAVLCVELIRRW